MNQFALGDMPIPGPPWLFITLLLLIFWLHLISMWVLVGTLIFGIKEVSERKDDWQQSRSIRFLPVIMAIVLNLGIPPLLFLQVLYSPFFFSSSILIAVPWISVFFLLMFGYGMIYAARYGAKNNIQAMIFLALSFIAVLTISFIFSNNMTLMIKPALWQQIYSYKQNGLNLNPELGEVVARWLWILSAAFAAGAVTIDRSKKWVIASAVISVISLFIYKGFLSPEILSSQLVNISFYSDLLISVAGLVLAFIPLKDETTRRILLGAWVGVKGLSVVAFRHGIRTASLDPIYPLNKLPVEHQSYLIALFVVGLIIGVVTLGWMFNNGRKDLSI
jgi:hypothetical protein